MFGKIIKKIKGEKHTKDILKDRLTVTLSKDRLANQNISEFEDLKNELLLVISKYTNSRDVVFEKSEENGRDTITIGIKI